VKSALRPRKRLTLTITNQTRRRVRPSVKRRRRIAKDVLLQAAAMMEHTPVMFDTNR
jgi:hypothetical protein